MEGERSEDENSTWDTDPKSGIIPRSLSHLFELLEALHSEFSVRISLLEIYNEEIYDLLAPEGLPKLKIYDDASKKGSVFVSGITEVPILEKSKVYEILQQGSNKRRTAVTNMNEFSSRSHSVFSITVHTKDTTINDMESEELVRIGKLNLVDLAGSENIGKSGAVDQRACEAGNINKSLLTLGRCITALVDRTPHVPYRESKLTRLLQDSLGGATKTSIIATISPGQNNLEESLNTLDYAMRSKNIHNKPKVNQKLTKKALIEEYDREINKLRMEIEAARCKSGVYLPTSQYEELKRSLEIAEANLIQKCEEISNYENLFQIKEEETKNLKEELLKIVEESKQTQGKLTEAISEKKQLARYGNKVYEEATKLKETFEVVSDDLIKVHEKVDRVKDVNLSNVENLQQLVDNMKFKISSVCSSTSASINNVHKSLVEDLNQNFDEINELNEKFSEDLQQMNTKLETLKTHFKITSDNMEMVLQKDDKNIEENQKILIKLQETLEKNLQIFHSIQRPVKEIQIKMKETEKLQERFMQTSLDSISSMKDTSVNLKTYLHLELDKFKGLTDDFFQVLQNDEKRKAFVRREVEEDEKFEEQLMKLMKMRKDRTERLKNFCEMKDEMDEQKKIKLKIEDHLRSVRDQIDSKEDLINEIKDQHFDSQRSTSQDIEKNFNKISDDVTTVFMNVQQKEEVLCELMTSQQREGLDLLEDQKKNLLSKMESWKDQEKVNYLASNETSSSFQTICQHKMILQQKSADLYQEFQPIPTSLHLLVKNLEKDEKDLVEITKSHSDNISLINPTGATPLRSAVYKSVKVSSPLPLAAECLEESLIEEDIDEDLEEETLEDLTKENVNKETDEDEEEVLIPDKPGVSFFASTKQQIKRNPTTTKKPFAKSKNYQNFR